MSDIDKIKVMLSSSNYDDLVAVRQHINGLLTVTSGTTSDNTDETLVLEAIVGFLENRGIEFNNVPMLRKINGYRAFAKKVPYVMKFIRHYIEIDRVKVRAVLTMSVEILYRDCTSMNIATSSRTLMSQIHRIPSLINREFPGYAEAGLLSMIIR